MIFSVVLTIVALGFMVCVHELGHMLAAKSFGVLVHEFSIGMGPKLFSVKKGETAYSLRLLPLGGFVRMEGENGESDNPRAFDRAAWWKRLIVLATGAIVNIAVGWILFVIINMGSYVVPTVVEEVPDSFMSESVFRAGDEILRIGKTRVHTINDVSMSLSMTDEDIVDVTVRRDGEKMTLRAPLFDVSGEKKLGVRFAITENPNILTSMRYGVYDTVYIVKAVLWAVRDLILGRQNVDSLSGPVEIVSVVDTVAQSGSENTLLMLMSLFAMIAVNLGVFNLLPIPALDGGQMLFVIIEKIIGRKIKPEIVGTINFIFFALLMILALYVTFGDVMGLIKS